MEKTIKEYYDLIINKVIEKISSELENEEKIKQDFQYLIAQKGVVDYQKYYSETINNDVLAKQDSNFFGKFKAKYALQGIDNEYLMFLETNKSKIIDLIRNDEIIELYQTYFFQAKIKHKDSYVYKNLGSFCAKLTHTFSPQKYCPLDIPIKDYLGLKSENFFTAFILISDAYSKYAKDNDIEVLKGIAKGVDFENKLFINEMTDLKFLDFIFWKRANVDTKNK